MTIAFTDFITAFPEFTNYDAGQGAFWIAQGYDSLSTRRFKPGRLDLAVMLYTAHNLVLEARNARAADAGAIPGTVQGPTASKTVDKVSISYATGAAIDGAGPYNETTYGTRLLRMIKAVGTGTYVPGPRRSAAGVYGYGRYR